MQWSSLLSVGLGFTSRFVRWATPSGLYPDRCFDLFERKSALRHKAPSAFITTGSLRVGPPRHHNKQTSNAVKAAGNERLLGSRGLSDAHF